MRYTARNNLRAVVSVSTTRVAAPVALPPDWRATLALLPEDAASLAEAVYESVSAALRRGQIPSGSRLVEGDLAQALAVSRTPVREALQRLEGEGLVKPAANRGYVVADLMADAEVVFLIRERLEGLAASRAARNMTLVQLETLQALQTEMVQVVESRVVDVERLVDLNHEFHKRITHASGSPRLVRLVDRLHPEYVSYQVIRSYDEEGRRRSINEHQAVLDALWNRDSALADRLIQSHLEHGKAVVLGEMKTAGTLR
jgi:DNA-binding GntR family transcriptional regulator